LEYVNEYYELDLTKGVVLITQKITLIMFEYKRVFSFEQLKIDTNIEARLMSMLG